MKITSFVVIIAISVAVTGCWGGAPLKATPSHLRAGSNQTLEGNAAYKKGCYQQAFDRFFRAHELFAASNQMEGVAMSFNNLGAVYRATGDPRSALALFDKAHDIYKDLGNPSGKRQALCNKAAALIDMNRLDEAQTVLDEIAEQAESASFIPLLSNRGILLTKKQDYLGAEKVLRAALDAADPENLSEQATLNAALGNLMRILKRYEEAVAFYQAALEADRNDGFYKGIADDLNDMGQVYLEMGNRSAAVQAWEQSVKVYTLVGLKKDVNEVMANLKTTAEQAGTDISITALFVNRWLEGKQYENLCKD